ncbi:hypothetical protein L6164_009807 [Bauhinia variegata]|uniref:Uncharacterized protein n=1 Tax=Bauhinia variegata TaxID=167791 RepID=A0ACB9PMJ7_BAUVA|nr:hypothetical protein L6164_009807 [Bauhinia variegata]
MELRSTFKACFFLFLLLVLPYFSKGGSEVVDSEIYEIDYRGPETHSSTPPPHDSHASTYPKNSLPPPKAKKPTNQKQRKVKKIRG